MLRYALAREQAAMEQYDALANKVPPGPVAHLFRYLANDELERKRELKKMYCEIVRSVAFDDMNGATGLYCEGGGARDN